MKIRKFENISPERYPQDVRSVIAQLAGTLNPILDTLYIALSKNITITDNTNLSLISFDVSTNEFNVPTTDTRVKTNLIGNCQGCIVYNHLDITSTSILSSTISTISAATPTTITTSATHNLRTGDAVSITGSNSTPSINGQYKIIATSPTTFQIPVAVSGSGSAGTVSQYQRQYPNDAIFVSFSEESSGIITIKSVTGIPNATKYRLYCLVL